jgi:pilus assembly protein Flp/PilA
MLRHLEPRLSDPRCSDPGRLPLRRLRRFALDRSGVTAVEYGLMAALIGLTIFAAVSSVGQGIKDTLYGQIVTALQNMGK